MDLPPGIGSTLRLSLPDEVIEITPDTTPEQRQKILGDVRTRYPDMLEQAPELESMILGTYEPARGDPLIEDITTREGKRKALEDMRRTMPEVLRQDPRIERAITGDRKAFDELVAEGVLVPQSRPDAAATSSTPAPAGTPEPSGPITHPKGLFARLFGRRSA